MPVKLLTQKVTSGGKGSIVLTKHEFQNTSEKDVRWVYIAAFIYDQSTPKKLLLIRKVMKLGFATTFYAGSTWQPTKTAAHWLNFAITRDGLISPLLNNGALEGDYTFAIGITKVVFTDDSEWRFKPPEQTVN